MPEADVQSFSGFLIPQGAEYMEAMLNTTDCISTGQVTLGDGVFTYKGVRDPVHETLYRVLTEAEANGQSIQVSSAQSAISNL